VEMYGYPLQPIPDEHKVLWSKCYKPDGTLCSEVENGTGTQMYWTPQGTKIWELELVNFERVRHTMWYRNGQLYVTETLVNGLVDGPFVSYYRSGVKLREGAYSKGDRVGKWIRYNEDGSVSKIEDYTAPTSQSK
ncbi:MAG: toxin-antitoxin system YwqK family antitoxin, partial [Planctomycetota bacterium]